MRFSGLCARRYGCAAHFGGTLKRFILYVFICIFEKCLKDSNLWSTDGTYGTYGLPSA